jgi:hypothetical protein
MNIACSLAAKLARYQPDAGRARFGCRAGELNVDFLDLAVVISPDFVALVSVATSICFSKLRGSPSRSLEQFQLLPGLDRAFEL